jgi:hypothetical protein
MKKRMLLSFAFAVALVCGGLALAQAPRENIDANRHPNLAAAQQHLVRAYESIKAAQAANKEELGDHAAKAAALLEQADRELKAAAEFADHRK